MSGVYIIVFISVFFILLLIAAKILAKSFKYIASDTEKAKRFISEGKNDLAIEKLRNILSKNKVEKGERAKIHSMIGECYYKTEEYPFAIVEYRHALDEGYYSPELVLSLGKCLSKIGKNEEALSQFLTLLKLDNNYKTIVSMEIGIIYYENHQYETAFKYFDNVLEIDKTNKEALKYKAYCFVNMENYIEAISIMENIIRKNQGDTLLNYNLGRAYKGRGNYKSAIKYYRVSSHDKLYAVKSLYEIALCYIELNNIELAITALDLAIEYNSPDRDLRLAVLYTLVECYDKMKNVNKAIEVLENIIIIDSNYKDVSKKLLEYKESRYSEGIKSFFRLENEAFSDFALKIVSCMNLIPYSLKTTNKKYLIVFAKEGKGLHAAKKVIFFRKSYAPIFNEELIQLYDYAVSYNIVNSTLVTSAMASPDAIRYASISRIEIVGIKRLEGLVEKANFTNLPVGVTRGEEKLDWIL